jgi:D-alanyl-lipoteichoic acid acyltransferase DltB (MBOAT superfamily)
MLFNSLEFFAFFAVVYLLYRILPFRWQNRLLIVTGYIFYGCWDVRFLFLIACSTTVDFCIGLLLANGRLPGAAALHGIVIFNWSCSSVFMPQLVGLKGRQAEHRHRRTSQPAAYRAKGTSRYRNIFARGQPADQPTSKTPRRT